MTLYLGKPRDEIEALAEADLLKVAKSLVPVTPGANDPKAAQDYQPYFFGGLFPTIGVAVIRSRGASRYADKRDRPGVLIAEVMVYQPCLPARGAATKQDDRTGPAKRNTRRVRGLFLKALFAETSPLAPHVTVIESRGGAYDDVGTPVFDEGGRNILWTDRTELEIAI